MDKPFSNTAQYAFPFSITTEQSQSRKNNALRIYTKAVRIVHSHELPELTESSSEEEREHHYDHTTAAESGDSLTPLNSAHHPVFTARYSSKESPTARRRHLHTRSRSDSQVSSGHSIDTSLGAAHYHASNQRNKALLAQRVRPLMALISPPRATFDAGPDSPPELTSSKSSKSSSFRTRSSDEDSGAAPQDAGNFEDITLDDLLARDGSADALAVDSVAIGKENFRGSNGSLSMPRTRSAMSSRHASISSAATVTMRDGANGASLHYPKQNTRANGASPRGSQSAMHLPASASPRRGFTSPVHPSMTAPPLPQPRIPSRSPSPTFLQSFGLTTQPLPRRSSSRSSLRSDSTIGPIGRRASWQPGRKTVKELEDEYDDNDEDIPEDAIVWNIPLSPRPPESRSESRSPERLERKKSDRSLSSKRSLRTRSSQQELQARSQPESGSIHALRRQRSSSAIVEETNGYALRPRPSPRPSPLQHAATDMTGLRNGLRHSSRTKSWNEALGELSSEARQLTAALEAFETQQETKSATSVTETLVDENEPERPNSATSAVNSTSLAANVSVEKPALRRPASTIELRRKVTLPPIRKGDMLLDPLPVSKEKEKVLTRTRPSWLPPKSQKEEKRHLREYKRMMEASIEAEKKREKRLQMEHEAKEAQEASLLRIWENTVLADWDGALAEPRTRELWWRGVPSQYRAEVWSRAVGNELHLSQTSYAAALQRAKDERTRLEHSKAQTHDTLSETDEDRLSQYRSMHADILTLSSHTGYHIFGPQAPLHDALNDVLSAYASYRNDVGYVSGIHMPAALLLTTLMPAHDAFIILANVLNRPTPMSHLLTTLRHRSLGTYDEAADPPGPIANTHTLVLRQLANKLPSLHAHLTSSKMHLRPQEYLDPLLSTLFCDARIGVERAARMWDIMAFEGDKVLVRAAVAVLSRLENKLYGTRDEVLAMLGWDGSVDWSGDLGDVEGWVKCLREAGKVDKRED